MRKYVTFSAPVRFVKVICPEPLDLEYVAAVTDEAAFEATLKYLREDIEIPVEVEDLEVFAQEDLAEAIRS